MAEITYLLGAGASYSALPVVSEMANAIGETVNWLRHQYMANSIINRFNTENGLKFQEIVTELEWLQKICDTSINFSVDTYARKLDLSELDDEYIRLKNILSFYFTIEQRRQSPDVRYDNFWASILKHRSQFPSNIRIISWNYDFQLELTYKDFLGTSSLYGASQTLNIKSPQTDSHNLTFPNRFGIFKLNGSATFNKTQESDFNYIVDDFMSTRIDEFIIQSVETYDKMSKSDTKYNNHLSFAWEHQTDSAFYEHLKQSVKNTEILVVIGYSFPFFNRDIDKLLLNDFMGGSLKKVYFQAPADDIEDIRERFLAINDNPNLNMVLRKDIKQFTLPNEL